MQWTEGHSAVEGDGSHFIQRGRAGRADWMEACHNISWTYRKR